MASLRDLLPLVLPHVPGCPEILALHNLRLSAIDWCERTRCWRHVASQVLTVNDPAIVVPVYAVVSEIEHAEFNGRQLEPVIYTDVTPEALDGGTSMWALTQKEPGQITLMAFSTGTLKLSLWLKPKIGNSRSLVNGAVVDAFDEIPQHIVDHHAESLRDGALARLLALPNEPYSNPGGAAFYKGEVDEKAPAARSRATKGQQRAPRRSKTIWW